LGGTNWQGGTNWRLKRPVAPIGAAESLPQLPRQKHFQLVTAPAVKIFPKLDCRLEGGILGSVLVRMAERKPLFFANLVRICRLGKLLQFFNENCLQGKAGIPKVMRINPAFES